MSVPANKKSPWLFRTYAGHSTAAKTNALFKTNLSKGQTGLSVAFDLPTQTGYDSDHPMAKCEIGKVGVPICHIDDMRTLFAGIPLESMNTSMTINATAVWMVSLYLVVAKEQGADLSKIQGTTQNDILKEYLSRGTHIFPPEPSLRLTTDLILHAVKNHPKFNPINVCPYHLQEAGATPVQEVAYGLLNAITVLETILARGEISKNQLGEIVGRVSFFLDSGIRFVQEMVKTRVFAKLWKQICAERFGIVDEKFSRFRYGVQVNSLGLTEQQPENNIIRIVLEMLGVTLSADSRARAVQLPAWNEGLGLPTPWDQQWSLRAQQILAYETDILDYGDLFAGSIVVQKLEDEMLNSVQAEMALVENQGGFIKAIESGFVKSRLVESQALRVQKIATGEQKVIGVNDYTESEKSPLTEGASRILKIDSESAADQIARLRAFKIARNNSAVAKMLEQLKLAAKQNHNLLPISMACAEAGVTTGEWAEALRSVFGTYVAPTGLGNIGQQPFCNVPQKIHEKMQRLCKTLGGAPRLLVAKPGLDGHSNGAEQIALAARRVGFEVIYQGIRLSPDEIVNTALQEDVNMIGLSILSGSHLDLVSEILEKMKTHDLSRIPIVLGGIIPLEDRESLLKSGISQIFTPQDFDLDKILNAMVDLLLVD